MADQIFNDETDMTLGQIKNLIKGEKPRNTDMEVSGQKKARGGDKAVLPAKVRTQRTTLEKFKDINTTKERELVNAQKRAGRQAPTPIDHKAAN